MAYVADAPSIIPEYEDMGSSTKPAENEESIDTRDTVAYDEVGKVAMNENVPYAADVPSTMPEYEEVTH